MGRGMTFFAISCKFFFQILAYLEEKKKSPIIVTFMPVLNLAFFKETGSIQVVYCDSSADTSTVCLQEVWDLLMY